MSLVITAHTGQTVALDCVGVQTPLQAQAPSRFTGLVNDLQVTFFFDVKTRARLFDLMPLSGLNVVQTPNRSGKIQLTSDKPCSYVRFRWDAPRARGYAKGWNPLYSHAEVEGVFAITESTLEGFAETMALTIYRGDWLLLNGQPVNFETGGV